MVKPAWKLPFAMPGLSTNSRHDDEHALCQYASQTLKGFGLYGHATLGRLEHRPRGRLMLFITVVQTRKRYSQRSLSLIAEDLEKWAKANQKLALEGVFWRLPAEDDDSDEQVGDLGIIVEELN